MKVWLKFGLTTVVLVLTAFVLVGFALGSEFEVRQERLIDASTDEVHDYLLPLHKWREPVQKGLSKEDPTAVVTTDGPDEGVGSMLRWSGEDVGEGWVRIVEEDEDRGVWYEFGTDGDDTTAWASIEYDERDEGTILVVHCKGELTPIIGGYIAPLLEKKLDAAIAWGLVELKREIEDGTIIDGIFNDVFQFFD